MRVPEALRLFPDVPLEPRHGPAQHLAEVEGQAVRVGDRSRRETLRGELRRVRLVPLRQLARRVRCVSTPCAGDEPRVERDEALRRAIERLSRGTTGRGDQLHEALETIRGTGDVAREKGACLGLAHRLEVLRW